MTIDERRLYELIEESQDQQSDAMKLNAAILPDLRDLAADRRRNGGAIVTPEQIAHMEQSRADLRRRLGLVAGGVVGFGAITALLSKSVAADEALDIQMLQTNSSLEILAIATYEAALTLPFIKDGNPVVKAFAETTMMQHTEHNQAFQAQTEALGGTMQTTPNPKYTPVVEAAKPTLKTPEDVVALAATLEQVATETYLNELNVFTDKASLTLTASIMGVESQHLATLRAVGALLAGGAEELIAIPTDLAKLPAAAGSVAFPDAFQGVSMASPPEEGAVK